MLDGEYVYHRELKDDVHKSVMQHWKERLVRTIPSKSPTFTLPSYDQFQFKFHNVKRSVENHQNKNLSNNTK